MAGANLLTSHQLPAGISKPQSARADPSQISDDNADTGVAATLLEEDPFSSEASKVLFDGMDELRRCGAAVDLDLPQVRLLNYPSWHCSNQLTFGVASDCRTTISRKVILTQKFDRHSLPSR
jgi:hypothetical protein